MVTIDFLLSRLVISMLQSRLPSVLCPALCLAKLQRYQAAPRFSALVLNASLVDSILPYFHLLICTKALHPRLLHSQFSQPRLHVVFLEIKR